jgi:hypothetical protein
MPTLLVRNAEVLVTMDGKRRELKNAGLYAVDGIIRDVGRNEDLPATADTVIDLAGQILLPGFVNTHHHLNQTLMRNLPAGQNNNLFPWLKAHYRVWARTTPQASRASTLIGLAELALSGCTTVFDHSYVFKNGNSVDCQIEAASELGVRFHASRGSMSLGESKGGLPPDDCVEDEAFILKDSQRVIERYHDAAVGSMTQIVLAPCSPFSVTTNSSATDAEGSAEPSCDEAASDAEMPIRRALTPVAFAQDLKEELSKMAPTRILKDDEAPKVGWMVEGRFDNVNSNVSSLAMHVKVTDVEKHRVIYEFDMAGGNNGQGAFGSIRGSGGRFATPFDLRNAAERILLVLSPDAFRFGARSTVVLQ